MREVQDPTKPNSNGILNGEAGVVGESDGWDAEFDEDTKFKRVKDNNYKIIQIANQKVKLISFIKNNIKIQFEVIPSATGWDQKARCPFKDHKDSSPSFYVNSEANSFKCFGCGKGGGPVHFISGYYNRDAISVAEDIISKYGDLEDTYNNIQELAQGEVDALVLDINNYVRWFIIENKDKPHFNEYFDFVERLMWTLDLYVEKHYANRSYIGVEKLTERIRIIKSKLNKYEQNFNNR